MKFKKLKEQKGILVSDAFVAILIILLFGGIITATIKNIVLESAKIKVESKMINLATEVLEYAEKIPYDDVSEERLISYVNNNYSDYIDAGTEISELLNSSKLYKMVINVEKYKDQKGDEVQYDIIKIITLDISTKIQNKEYSTSVRMVKKASESEIKAIMENS